MTLFWLMSFSGSQVFDLFDNLIFEDQIHASTEKCVQKLILDHARDLNTAMCALLIAIINW